MPPELESLRAQMLWKAESTFGEKEGMTGGHDCKGAGASGASVNIHSLTSSCSAVARTVQV